MAQDIFVEIEKNHFQGDVKIWFIKDNYDTRTYYSVKDGIMQLTEFKMGDYVQDKKADPLLIMPSRLAGEFIEALVVSAKAKGISIKEESEIKGQLIAKQQEIDFLKEKLSKFIDKATYIK